MKLEASDPRPQLRTAGQQEIVSGVSFTEPGLADKHPHASFQSEAGYQQVMKCCRVGGMPLIRKQPRGLDSWTQPSEAPPYLTQNKCIVESCWQVAVCWEEKSSKKEINWQRLKSRGGFQRISLICNSVRTKRWQDSATEITEVLCGIDWKQSDYFSKVTAANIKWFKNLWSTKWITTFRELMKE